MERKKMNRRRGPKWTLEANSVERSIRRGKDFVEIHIEELVLHGFPPGDRYRIADALQQELTHLLEARTLPACPQDIVAVNQINAGTIRLNSGANARVIGGKAAHALHQGISRLGEGR